MQTLKDKFREPLEWWQLYTENEWRGIARTASCYDEYSMCEAAIMRWRSARGTGSVSARSFAVPVDMNERVRHHRERARRRAWRAVWSGRFLSAFVDFWEAKYGLPV